MKIGTASLSQFATILSQLTVAAPKSLEGIDVVELLRVTEKNGAGLSLNLNAVWCQMLEAQQTAAELPATPSNILIVDRSNGRLDPAGFDPSLSDWKTAKDFDSRLLSVTQMDMSKVTRVHMLEADESWIAGEDRLKRMLAVGHMGFDLHPMKLLWEDYLRCKASECGVAGSILEKHFRETGYVDAMGQLLLSPDGGRYVLYFYRFGGESPEWGWGCRRLDGQWDASDPSVALASTLG